MFYTIEMFNIPYQKYQQSRIKFSKSHLHLGNLAKLALQENTVYG